MPVLMIRYQVADEGVAKVIGAIEAAFAALEKEKPKGLKYAYCRRAGSTEFVGVVALDEGIDNPLLGIPAARELQSTVAKWVVGSAPTPQPLEILGSYGFTR